MQRFSWANKLLSESWSPQRRASQASLRKIPAPADEARLGLGWAARRRVGAKPGRSGGSAVRRHPIRQRRHRVPWGALRRGARRGRRSLEPKHLGARRASCPRPPVPHGSGRAWPGTGRCCPASSLRPPRARPPQTTAPLLPGRRGQRPSPASPPQRCRGRSVPGCLCQKPLQGDAAAGPLPRWSDTVTPQPGGSEAGSHRLTTAPRPTATLGKTRGAVGVPRAECLCTRVHSSSGPRVRAWSRRPQRVAGHTEAGATTGSDPRHPAPRPGPASSAHSRQGRGDRRRGRGHRGLGVTANGHGASLGTRQRGGRTDTRGLNAAHFQAVSFAPSEFHLKREGLRTKHPQNPNTERVKSQVLLHGGAAASAAPLRRPRLPRTPVNAPPHRLTRLPPWRSLWPDAGSWSGSVHMGSKLGSALIFFALGK